LLDDIVQVDWGGLLSVSVTQRESITLFRLR